MLINYLLFWMMVVEAIVCLLICLPFGKSVSLSIIQFIHSRIGGKDSVASTVGTVVLAIVSLLFLSDVNAVYKHHTDDSVWSDGLRIRLLTAQRDMYITGFCLFLFLLLRLVYHSLETNMRLEKSLAAMKKQAEGASAGYKKLLEENESTTAQLKKLKELVGDDDDTVKKSGAKPLATLLEENAELEKKLATVTKELKSAETKIDAVKKQAEGQSAAFMKLMDDKSKSDKQIEEHKLLEAKLKAQKEEIAKLTTERDALKSQVQDYDFMFADAKKKAD